MKYLSWTSVFVATALLIAVFLWVGISPYSSPDPTARHIPKLAAILDIGILVFREGLECVLVLAAITASMTGPQQIYRRSVMAGAGVGFIATLISWRLAVRVLEDISQTVSALDLQAGTGLLAVVVLLVVMNWFFHKMYWTGWIAHHHQRRRRLAAHTSMRRVPD